MPRLLTVFYEKLSLRDYYLLIEKFLLILLLPIFSKLIAPNLFNELVEQQEYILIFSSIFIGASSNSVIVERKTNEELASYFKRVKLFLFIIVMLFFINHELAFYLVAILSFSTSNVLFSYLQKKLGVHSGKIALLSTSASIIFVTLFFLTSNLNILLIFLLSPLIKCIWMLSRLTIDERKICYSDWNINLNFINTKRHVNFIILSLLAYGQARFLKIYVNYIFDDNRVFDFQILFYFQFICTFTFEALYSNLYRSFVQVSQNIHQKEKDKTIRFTVFSVLISFLLVLLNFVYPFDVMIGNVSQNYKYSVLLIFLNSCLYIFNRLLYMILYVKEDAIMIMIFQGVNFLLIVILSFLFSAKLGLFGFLLGYSLASTLILVRIYIHLKKTNTDEILVLRNYLKNQFQL